MVLTGRRKPATGTITFNRLFTPALTFPAFSFLPSPPLRPLILYFAETSKLIPVSHYFCTFQLTMALYTQSLIILAGWRRTQTQKFIMIQELITRYRVTKI